MFDVAERERVRRRLLELASADPDVVGAAIVGSHAREAADRFSDIDLAFAVSDVQAALGRWTALMHKEFRVLHHWDLPAGASVYRVFLLPGWLEVDIGFKLTTDFGARGPSWRTVFGEAVQLPPAPPPTVDSLVGMGWHHAMHAYVCIERERSWQAVHWIGALRDHVVTLMCTRFGLGTAFAKEVHLLPAGVTDALDATLARSLDPAELRHALRALIGVFQTELAHADPDLAARLQLPLAELSALLSSVHNRHISP